MALRGIRGATTAAGNSSRAIVDATVELLEMLIEENQIDPTEIAFIYFTTTRDLDAEFPALAARQLGWSQVPMLCGQEIPAPPDNPRSIPFCIRLVILYNTERPQGQMRAVYLRGATALKREIDRLRLELGR